MDDKASFIAAQELIATSHAATLKIKKEELEQKQKDQTEQKAKLKKYKDLRVEKAGDDVAKEIRLTEKFQEIDDLLGTSLATATNVKKSICWY